jgi:dihydroneopterin aldolase
MRFHAAHGALPQERLTGNSFIVNLRICADLDLAAASDSLRNTINYAEAFEVVSHEMNIPSDLIENVACRILRALKNRFPSILEVEVRVEKLNPPIAGADMDSAAITLTETCNLH